jgi:hypothetical protein
MSVVAFRIEKPASAVQPQASVANVLPFRRPPQHLRKRELVTGAGGVRALNEERTPLTATAANGGTSRWSGRRVAINDFAHNGRPGHAIEKREALTTENAVGLTLEALLATAFLFMSVATGPALDWLLLRTAS